MSTICPDQDVAAERILHPTNVGGDRTAIGDIAFPNRRRRLGAPPVLATVLMHNE
ncbi:hypothetical protein [Roseimaritima multifibrata]|uniref:hypothetical protein n=1 Tax=Roseimaritima multifibrata TaxID=1930274 RepID=UPI001C54D9CF|nr:hypothetical protein [Roseimaritima multifibrata]